MAYGEGTKTEIEPGVWRLRISAGRDPHSGKLRQPEIPRFRGTERQARKRLAEMVAARDAGTLDPSTATVAQVLTAWLEFRKPHISQTTYREHERTVRRDIVPKLGKIQAAKLTGHEIDNWMGKMTAAGRKSATVRRRFSVLRAAMAQARKWGWIRDNPCDFATQPPIGQTPELAVPKPEELGALRDTSAARETPEGELLAFALMLAALTGCRRGEQLALRWDDVDLPHGLVTVSRSRTAVKGSVLEGPTKTHQSRTIGIGPELVRTLKARQKAQRALAKAAGVELDPNPYWLSLRADAAAPVYPDWLTKQFGILCNGRWRYHDLRHWAGTYMTDSGSTLTTVMKRLGHQSTRTTERYLHPVEGRDREAAAALDALVR